MSEDVGECACGQPSASVVVTVNDWILELCDACARKAVDPLAEEAP